MKICAPEKCCGCGNCETVCAANAVKMELNNEGFWMPVIDTFLCIKCSKCVSVCPMVNDLSNLQCKFGKYAFYGYVSDKGDLASCSSGGLATALAKTIIMCGGVVYGSVYTNDFHNVVVERIDTISQIEKLKGSKYVQSYKNKIYQLIDSDLKDGLIVLYIGLPCEIAALKFFLKRESENLITVDLVCHGPTSTYALIDYIKRYEGKAPNSIRTFSMRFKKNGMWTPYYMFVEKNSGKKHLEPFWGSDFGYVFGRFARESCYNCSFKCGNRYADISLGDAWGASTEGIMNDNAGLSAIIVNSDKGLSLMKTIEGIKMVEADLDEILKENPNLVYARRIADEREKIARYLNKYGLFRTVLFVKPLKKRIRDKIHILKNNLLG